MGIMPWYLTGLAKFCTCMCFNLFACTLILDPKVFHSCYSCPDVVLGNSFTTLNWRYDSTWKCSVESFLEFIGNYFSLFFTNNIKGSNSIPADPDQWPPSWVPQALSRMLYHPKDAFYDSHANCYDEVQYV